MGNAGKLLIKFRMMCSSCSENEFHIKDGIKSLTPELSGEKRNHIPY